ncbi:MAG TPA: VWA domain-containing protein [Planctomycetota bacterium]|nr:VWA domain-containing protein [Planctomycetota bacterium]
MTPVAPAARPRAARRGAVRGATFVALLLVLAGAPRAARGETEYDAAAREAGAALNRKDRPALRAAVERLRATDDARAVDLLVRAAKALADERDKIEAARRKDQAEVEAMHTALEREMRRFERITMPSSLEVDRHTVRRLELDGRYREAGRRVLLAGGEVEAIRADLEAVRLSVTAVLGRLDAEAQAAAIARLLSAWVRSPGTDAEDRVRFVDAVERVPGPAAAAALREVSEDVRLDPRPRVVALAARVDRGDEHTVADAIARLDDPAWSVEAAAIEALRVLHDREAVEPLIAFLGRDGIGRLREDAHRALRSLTGEAHGPYREPWETWWREAKATFELPRRATATRALLAPRQGVTFYGITTFSQRVVFVLDVSQSMTELSPAPGKRPPEARIEAARRELAAAVAALDDSARLAVLTFEEGVRAFETAIVAADRATRERAIAWARSQDPHGPTNLHAALEEAFRLAAGGVAEKVPTAGADTIFLLTDGEPTAGAVREPDAIVAAVKRWHRASRVVVHCVGLGSHDVALLAAIASATGGQYVAR